MNVSAEAVCKILLVEDSRFFGRLVRSEIKKKLKLDVDWADSFAGARALIDNNQGSYFMALLDIVLPDSQDGEVVDYCIANDIPSVVFTGVLSDGFRQQIWQKNIIDYVLKGNPSSLHYLISLVSRIVKNRSTKILVVDDSRASRLILSQQLRQYQCQVIEAGDGLEGCEALEANPDIKLVLADYNMPRMDGLEMVKRMRLRRDRESLAIIGVASGSGDTLSVKFIKGGANDFISKPFFKEELYCRIAQNLENLELMESLRHSAERDYLTGLYNRRFFFESAGKIFASAKRGHTTIAAAMVDIDHFKRINDRYGHDTGDVVLQQVSAILKDQTRDTDVLARFGGEEFCVLCVNPGEQVVENLFERLRRAIADATYESEGERISVTVSIGVCVGVRDMLSHMLTEADERLYDAKSGGRNRVISSGRIQAGEELSSPPMTEHSST